MMIPFKQHQSPTVSHRALSSLLLLIGLLSASWLHAESAPAKIIRITLGDYRYMPGDIQLAIDQPVILRLTNADSFTPHNFTLEDASDGLDVNVDIPAGDTVDVHLMPPVAGSHPFYCRNKLWLMDSHRDKGMTGILTVLPARQAL